MGYFALSGITGCVSPVETPPSQYGIMYNGDKIVGFHKKDAMIDFIQYYMVVVTFENYTQIFQFTSMGDRDTFYGSL